MEHAHPPILPALIAVGVALFARSGDRKPVITLEGETSGPLLGAAFAADGPVLAVIDGSPECTEPRAPCRAILRIERVAGNGVVQEGRFVLDRREDLPKVALRGELAATYHPRGLLEVYKRRASTWTRVARLEAPRACTNFAWASVHLGTDFIVLDTPDTACIFVARRDSWILEQKISHPSDVFPAVADDVLFLVSADGVVAYQRSRGTWKGTQVVRSASSRMRSIAVSERWLVIAEQNGDRVEVYDRQRGYAAHATLPSRYAWSVSVTADTLVVTGFGSRAWRFDGTTWSDQTNLEHWERSGSGGNAIGTKIWIGDPAVDRGQSGYIRGYELP